MYVGDHYYDEDAHDGDDDDDDHGADVNDGHVDDDGGNMMWLVLVCRGNLMWQV